MTALDDVLAEQAIEKIKSYEDIVEKYVPAQKTTDHSYSQIKWACIEALVLLNGDEEKFKACLKKTKDNNPGMGWGFDFDKYNVQQASHYIKVLASLMQ